MIKNCFKMNAMRYQEDTNNGLDPELCQIVLDNNPKYVDIIRQLFKETSYMTTTYIIDAMTSIITEWKSKRNDELPLYVTLPHDNQTGSEWWIYNQFKDLLPKHEVITEELDISPHEINDIPHEIIALDDWMLSGQNMAERFELLCQKHTSIPHGTIFTILVVIATPESLNILSALLACSEYQNISIT